MALDSMKEIFDRMEQEGKPFWEIVLETDMDERQVTRNQSMAKMLMVSLPLSLRFDRANSCHWFTVSPNRRRLSRSIRSASSWFCSACFCA